MTPPAVEGLLRELAPQALGAVARRYGEFADAEDAVQEALVTAAVEWQAGLPLSGLVRMARREGMQGILSLSETFLMMRS